MIVQQFNINDIENQIEQDMDWASKVVCWDNSKTYSHNTKIMAGKLMMFLLDNKKTLLNIGKYIKLREDALKEIINNDNSLQKTGEQIEMFANEEE